MGLFNSIVGKFYCPYCGDGIFELQNKDLDPRGETFTLEEFKQALLKRPHGRSVYIRAEVHKICRRCEAYISLSVEVRDEANLAVMKEEFGGLVR